MTPQEREAFHDTRADDWAREVYKRNPPGESMTESTTPTLDAMEALKPYPNLYAIMQGTVSGSVTEWPAIRTELARLVGFFSEGSAKWIKVEENLPRDGVLVAVRYSDGEHGYDIYENGGWVSYEAALEEFQAIRCAEMTFGTPPCYWMPLPEAPKS